MLHARSSIPDRRNVSRGRRAAFTLIELLVVILILGVLFALLLPAVQSARQAARRSHCMNTFRQYGIDMHSYLSEYNAFPPCSAGTNSCSAHVLMLPYMEQVALYNSANLLIGPEYSPQNSTLVFAQLETLWCPCDPYVKPWRQATMPCMTNYAANMGDDSILRRTNGALHFRAAHEATVPDGFSTTVAMSEFLVGRRGVIDRLRSLYVPTGGPPATRNQFIQWCKGLIGEGPTINGLLKGEYWTIAGRGCCLYNHVMTPNQPSCSRTPGSGTPVSSSTATSLHPGGVNCLFADGHVQFVRDGVNGAVWRAIGTRNGGEVVSAGSY